MVTGLNAKIMPAFTADQSITKYQLYFVISTLSSTFTGSMADYIEMVMDIQKERTLCCMVKLVDPVINMIAYDMFQIMKPDTMSTYTMYVVLAIITAMSQLISYLPQFYEIFRKKNNRLPIRLNFQNFKPFRPVLFARMLRDQFEYIFASAGEPTVALLVMIFTQQDYNSSLYYPDMATICFMYIRLLTKAGQCVQFSTKRFLDTYINANQQINSVTRVTSIMTKGLAAHVVVNLCLVGAIYGLSDILANMVIPLSSFNSYE